jgi:hypothetical protein
LARLQLQLAAEDSLYSLIVDQAFWAILILAIPCLYRPQVDGWRCWLTFDPLTD